jgi:hypothetical protein
MPWLWNIWKPTKYNDIIVSDKIDILFRNYIAECFTLIFLKSFIKIIYPFWPEATNSTQYSRFYKSEK